MNAASRLGITEEVDLIIDRYLSAEHNTRADFVAAAVDLCHNTAAKTLFVKRRAGQAWDADPNAGKYADLE
jgi:hypothetical protein